jgi:hypothetical protein
MILNNFLSNTLYKLSTMIYFIPWGAEFIAESYILFFFVKQVRLIKVRLRLGINLSLSYFSKIYHLFYHMIKHFGIFRIRLNIPKCLII